MLAVRLPIYGLAALIVLVAGYLLALFGLYSCSPDPLPGETAWVWKTWIRQSFGIVQGSVPPCFLDTWRGAFSLRSAGLSGHAALGALAAAFLFETLGRGLRKALMRRRGGHAILAGEPGEIETLAHAVPGRSRVFIGRNRPLARAISSAFPWAETLALDERPSAEDIKHVLSGWGAGEAKLVAAATASDLTNGDLSRAALELGGSGDVLVRFEQTGLRTMKSDDLRRDAERGKRKLTVVSLRQMQTRLALSLARPGRFVDEGARRVHLALCGAGPAMQEMAFLLARQGYGLEQAPPILSVLRTGRTDFTAGALERLAATGTIEMRVASADGHDALFIDREFVGIAEAKEPLAAMFCCEEEEGAAMALAIRLERALLGLEMPVPPIVVLGAGPAQGGETGMISVGREPDLAQASARAARLDERAMAFHAAYLEGQRSAAGRGFGALPAEREWETLSEADRDQNRHAADHIEYKAARAGLALVPRPTRMAFEAAETELLAAVEHARWLAVKGVAGFRHGETRDDRLLLHPDIKPYAELDDDAKRKDREQVSAIPGQLARAGEGLARVEAREFATRAEALREIPRLADQASADGGRPPLVVAMLDGADGIAVAEAALAAGLLVEARAPAESWGSTGAVRNRRAASILRRAWRIRIVRSPTGWAAGKGQGDAEAPIAEESDHDAVVV